MEKMSRFWHKTTQLFRAVLGMHLDGDRSACAYWQYQCNGGPMATCSGGCYEEPRCITETPIGGWPSERGPWYRIMWAWRGGED